MRKLIVWLLLVMMLLMSAPGAYAEESFSMAGYDDEESKRVWKDNLFFERMEERTGVQLDLEQYMTQQDWIKAKEDMFSGTAEMPDALFKAQLTTQETQAWYKAGKLIDLKPYLAEYAPNLWAELQEHPEWLEAITLPDGAIVALPAIDELQFNNAVWINQAWLKRLKLDMPTTAEELTRVLRAFRDYDVNGNVRRDDEIPLTYGSMWDLRFLAHAFGINANDYYVTMDEGGQVKEILTLDENRAFLEWLKSLWDEGLLDKNGFTRIQLAEGPDADADVIYGMMIASSPAELVHYSHISDYVILDPLVYGGRQVYRDLTGDLTRGTFAITSACEKPEELLSWVDYLYTEEGFILSDVGMAGEEFDWNDDGTWLWVDASETLLAKTLPEATIRGGAGMPGKASVSFQQKMDASAPMQAATVHVVNELLRLKGVDTMPYPMVWLTLEQQERVDELIYQIGSYAEQQMVWFIVGDVPLNDETWNEFCQTVREKGIDEMVSIWQSAADAR